LTWGPDIYPEVLNLATAKEDALTSAFGQWPPKAPVIEPADEAHISRLTGKQEQSLISVYKKVTDDTSESFVYTDEFEVLFEAFVARTGLDVSRTQVWRWLSNIRKRGRLPRKRRN